MDNQFPPAAEHRPAPAVLGALEPSCRALLADRAMFDDRYLNALGNLLPNGHPLRQVPGAALDLLDVLMRAAVSGDPPERVEAECQECGARCAAMGLPDDTFPAIGRAASRAAREVVGESWTSALSSGWAALHLWVVEHLTAGASRGRSRGRGWQSFPDLVPPKPPAGQPWDEGAPSGLPAPSQPAPSQPAPSQPAPGRPVTSRPVSAATEWALLEQAAGVTSPGQSPGQGAFSGPAGEGAAGEGEEDPPDSRRAGGPGISWTP